LLFERARAMKQDSKETIILPYALFDRRREGVAEHDIGIFCFYYLP